MVLLTGVLEKAAVAHIRPTVIIITLGALWRFDGIVKKNQLLSFLSLPSASFGEVRELCLKKNVVHRIRTITTAFES